MNLEELLKDKSIKGKEKTELISQSILNQTLSLDVLLSFAQTQKEPINAILIEAIEFSTKQNPNLANENTFNFVIQSLTAKAPRIKWESAKVIANIAHLFPDKLQEAIHNLLLNSNHEGTVVRWSVATVLTEIIKATNKNDQELLSHIEKLYLQEEKNSIKKIYKTVMDT